MKMTARARSRTRAVPAAAIDEIIRRWLTRSLVAASFVELHTAIAKPFYTRLRFGGAAHNYHAL
jgi:hypothetical protein